MGQKQKDKKATGIEAAVADKKFIKAEVKIEGDKLVVWSANLASPVTVRNGWVQDPFYIEDLPASPFKTDNW